MARKLQVGSEVRVGKGRGIAQRYQGRTGTVIGTAGKTAAGNARFEVSMGARRLAPLVLTENRLALV
jgi:ribosomal protein L21E